MRLPIWCVVAGAVLCGSPARAQNPSYGDECVSPFDEGSIAGCSSAIQSGRLRGKDLAKAYNIRGNAYSAKRDYDRAIADYTEAIRLDPKNAQAYFDRGDTYFYFGTKGDDFARAIADYTDVILLSPASNDHRVARLNAPAYFNRGVLYYSTGDYDHAIADFTEVLRLDPQDPQYASVYYQSSYEYRCSARALAGRDLPGALADCNESLRLKPNDPGVLYKRGLVELKLGAFDQAIADYGAALAQNAKDAASLYGRGLAKLKAGDTAGGNDDIAAAKALKPDIADVYAGYGVK